MRQFISVTILFIYCQVTHKMTLNELLSLFHVYVVCVNDGDLSITITPII